MDVFIQISAGILTYYLLDKLWFFSRPNPNRGYLGVTSLSKSEKIDMDNPMEGYKTNYFVPCDDPMFVGNSWRCFRAATPEEVKLELARPVEIEIINGCSIALPLEVFERHLNKPGSIISVFPTEVWYWGSLVRIVQNVPTKKDLENYEWMKKSWGY